MMTEVIAGNVYDKYQTRNPLARWFTNGYLKHFDALLSTIDPKNILEVGCGEGHLIAHLRRLKPKAVLEGSDYSQEIINAAKSRNPGVSLKAADVLNLPYADGAYELVVAAEVLEHVAQYEKALKEIARVGSKYFLLSVPQEPIWRVLNCLRLKYVGQLGNTPGHVNHFSRQQFLTLARRYLDIKEESHPFPWSMVLCTKKN